MLASQIYEIFTRAFILNGTVKPFMQFFKKTFCPGGVIPKLDQQNFSVFQEKWSTNFYKLKFLTIQKDTDSILFLELLLFFVAQAVARVTLGN